MPRNSGRGSRLEHADGSVGSFVEHKLQGGRLALPRRSRHRWKVVASRPFGWLFRTRSGRYGMDDLEVDR